MASYRHRKMVQAPALKLCHLAHSAGWLYTNETRQLGGQHRKMAQEHASATALLVKLYRNIQAHPPAAGGQPLPRFEQHHAFLATLQPAIQLANPASQSYGGDVAIGDTHPPPP